MMTISVMMRGHSEVTWWGDMRMRMTRKQRKTALWTAGELGIVRKLSANRSEKITNPIVIITGACW